MLSERLREEGTKQEALLLEYLPEKETRLKILKLNQSVASQWQGGCDPLNRAAPTAASFDLGFGERPRCQCAEHQASSKQEC